MSVAATPATAGERPSRGPRSVILPLLLIGLGALLLANNLGYLSWQVWTALWQYWPVVLILLGIEILFTRRVSWGFVLLVALLLVLGTVSGRLGTWDGRVHGVPPLVRGTTHQELADAHRAVVSVSLGAGQLRVAGQDPSADLAQWSLHGDEGLLRRSYEVRDGVGRLELLYRGIGPGAGWPPIVIREDDWLALDLGLNGSIPLDLEIRMGASAADLDLTAVNLRSLELNAGASQGVLRLPSSSNGLPVSIRGGASSMAIHVPPDTAARVVSTGGLSSLRVDSARFVSVPGAPGTVEFRTLQYDPARPALEIALALGAASVDIR